MLAVETGILYAILRPPTFRGQGTRLGLALLYSLMLLLLAFVTFVTDMPGYVNIPGFFALSTSAALLILGAGTAVFRLLRPAAPRSEPPVA